MLIFITAGISILFLFIYLWVAMTPAPSGSDFQGAEFPNQHSSDDAAHFDFDRDPRFSRSR